MLEEKYKKEKLQIKMSIMPKFNLNCYKVVKSMFWTDLTGSMLFDI